MKKSNAGKRRGGRAKEPGKRSAGTQGASGRRAAPRCDACGHFSCAEGKDCFDGRDRYLALYRRRGAIRRIASAAARVEAEHYGAATRLEEIALFAQELGASHLGVAFCSGLREEASRACRLLRKAGFKVSSVCCKSCAVPKDALGLPKVRPERKAESLCNPVGQADLLNRAKTDLNIAAGLCVGHDALFFGRSKAPVVCWVAKDRVLAHNPVAAVSCPYVNRRVEEKIETLRNARRGAKK